LQLLNRYTSVHIQLLEAEGAEYKGKNSTAVAKARQFYAACMNTTSTESQGSTPLLKVFNFYICIFNSNKGTLPEYFGA
jgi:hypothetical protein